MNLMQMKKFIGEELSKEHLKKMESYSYEHLAILIPTSNEAAYKQWGSYRYVAYKIDILLACEEKVDVPRKHYLATICSPEENETIREIHCEHYYSIMIEPSFFETQYKLYDEQVPLFKGKQFAICADEEGIIFHTSSAKDLSLQLQKNNKVEACFQCNGIQIRVSGEAHKIEDDNLKAEIFAHPTRKFLQAWIELGIEHLFTMYRIKNCEAVYWTMERNFEPKEIIKF